MRTVVAVGVAVVTGLGVAGCAAGDTGVRSRVEAEADVARHAGQTAEIIDSELSAPVLTSWACGNGGYSVRGDYLMPVWIRWQARRRAALRTTWEANQMPITVDESPDGWLGTIGAVTPDGYRIEVSSAPGPRPTHVALSVVSPCWTEPRPSAEPSQPSESPQPSAPSQPSESPQPSESLQQSAVPPRPAEPGLQGPPLQSAAP